MQNKPVEGVDFRHPWVKRFAANQPRRFGFAQLLLSLVLLFAYYRIGDLTFAFFVLFLSICSLLGGLAFVTWPEKAARFDKQFVKRFAWPASLSLKDVVVYILLSGALVALTAGVDWLLRTYSFI